MFISIQKRNTIMQVNNMPTVLIYYQTQYKQGGSSVKPTMGDP